MDKQAASDIGASAGFKLEQSGFLNEINGFAHVYKHLNSGARLLYLENNDPNMSFSISFKTPAFDNTGVFHILEHSVLCGSEKYPVKEPFVTLLKSSMQTFLNAMTFPDKTVYPVASTNEKDLMNLMKVYLDAVFHPNIYSNKRIFEQEGWHLEIDEQNNGNLVYNGVVFNEMKGALSDPDQVLYNLLSSELFPDTTYKFESGGDPACIPSLTYEQFLDTHTKYYTPNNAYIILYGSLDAKNFMQYINSEYLIPISNNQKSLFVPRIELQSPIVSVGTTCNMNTSPENSCTAFGYVIGNISEREKIVASAVLLDAIMGSNESPLKRALLDSNIADDFESYITDSILQPFVMISAKGLKEDAAKRMNEVILSTIESLSGANNSAAALDESLIEASLSRCEFSMREFDFGYPDGVMHAISCMNGWLYDDNPDSAINYIKYEDLLASLRAKIGSGYYPALLSEIFLQSNHHAQVEVKPVTEESNSVLNEQLFKLQSSLSASDIEKIAHEVDLLRASQMQPDSDESLSMLPHLDISDISCPPEESTINVCDCAGIKLLLHDEPTHGICYFSQYFDIGNCTFDELGFVSVLSMLLGKLDTANHSASELDILVQSTLGSSKYVPEVFDKELNGSFEPFVAFSCIASCLDAKVEDAFELILEILFSTDFSDKDRIHEILVQRKVLMEQSFSAAGNSVALARAASYFNKSSLIREQLSGIDFYVFLKRLIDDITSNKIDISNKLTVLSKKLFSKSPMILSYGGSLRCLEYVKVKLAMYFDLSDVREHSSLLLNSIPSPLSKHEAFVVPTDVSYSALVATISDGVSGSNPFDGRWLVLSRILTLDYLWNEVRVIGGAYGVGFSAARNGIQSFYSYRDPHIDETFERFSLSDNWLEQFSPSPEEFDGYIISTTSAFDKPLKPKSLIRRQASMYFSNYSRKQFLEYRSQVVETSLESLKELIPMLSNICSNTFKCVVGSRKLIDASSSGFTVVDLLNLK